LGTKHSLNVLFGCQKLPEMFFFIYKCQSFIICELLSNKLLHISPDNEKLIFIHLFFLSESKSNQSAMVEKTSPTIVVNGITAAANVTKNSGNINVANGKKLSSVDSNMANGSVVVATINNKKTAAVKVNQVNGGGGGGEGGMKDKKVNLKVNLCHPNQYPTCTASRSASGSLPLHKCQRYSLFSPRVGGGYFYLLNATEGIQVLTMIVSSF
jgi:hypothetical protein